MLGPASTTSLPTEVWIEQMRGHMVRVSRYTKPARERKDRGIPHPIEDFLFQYYPFPLALLENWQPGLKYSLECPENELLPGGAVFNPRHYRHADGLIMVNPEALSDKELQRISWIKDLLIATASRAPMFSCHGLHEWAMVYGGATVRHEKTTSLRLSQSEIDAVVTSRPICCSHHDAFRFFAPDARSFNRLQPSLETRMQHEQPGCVHANMDLYKWCAKMMPWVGSDLLLDCFELAMELRSLDMRASPYDLSEWDCEPIRIETAEGRRAYEVEQKRLAFEAMRLRARLIAEISHLLALTHRASAIF